MKRILLIITLLVTLSVSAQRGTSNHNAIADEGRAPYRTRFVSYDIRGEADADKRVGSKYFRSLQFRLIEGGENPRFEATVEIPSLWLERDIFIRDEGRTGRYRLSVNGQEVGVNSDTYGGAEFYITPYLKEGGNSLKLVFAADIAGGDMERHTPEVKRSLIENLYLFSQPRIHVFDYTIEGYPHPEGLDGVVALDVVMTNGYNFPETVRVGMDVYDPAGNLKTYNFTEVTIRGTGCDTVRFRDKLIGYQKHFYSAEHPALYRVVISVRYNNRPIEYIPLQLGFGTTRFVGKQLLRNGKPIKISAVEFEATSDRKTTLTQLRTLKKRGINTLNLTRPHEEWFYDMCQNEGLYLFDCAAVECDPRSDNRGIGGTIANNPEYLARFIDRQQGLYYRGRNRANIIGRTIGTPSGNGYNMYKSYQWLKAADSTRMVVYGGADGEWNTDIVK